MSAAFVRRTVLGSLVVSFALWYPPALVAQTPAPAADIGTRLAAGTRIRVAIRDNVPPRISGALVALTDGTLHVRPDGDTTSLAVPLGLVVDLEVRGPRGHALQGFLVGSAIGAGAGIVLGIASGDDRGDMVISRGQKAVIAGTALGLLGGALGTLVGLIDRSDGWVHARPPYGLALAPQREGFRLTVSLELSSRCR